MSMFSAPTAPAPSNVPANAPAAMQGDPAQAGNPTVPTGTPPVAGQNSVVPDNNPLDTFKDMWTAPAADPNTPQTPAEMFNVNPQQLMEAAKKVDFSRVITPEQSQAIMAGGEGAAKAFAEAMNAMSQTVYAQSAMASTQMVQEALKRQEAYYTANLPSQIKAQSLSTQLLDSNPALSHPAAAPLISAITKQLQQKHPQATPAQLQKMAQDYVTSFADVASGKKPPETPAVDPTQDWDNW